MPTTAQGGAPVNQSKAWLIGGVRVRQHKQSPARSSSGSLFSSVRGWEKVHSVKTPEGWHDPGAPAIGWCVVGRVLKSLNAFESLPHTINETFYQRCMVSFVGLDETS